MNIGERIRQLRRSLDLTQKEFGERINLKPNSIALIEGGRNTSDQTISAICREFGVNEKWLRTGEGEIMASVPTTELDQLASRYKETMLHDTFVLIEKLVNLPTADQITIMGFLREIAAGVSDVPLGTLVYGDCAVEAREKAKAATIEQLHAELDRQQGLEKEAEKKSEVS